MFFFILLSLVVFLEKWIYITVKTDTTNQQLLPLVRSKHNSKLFSYSQKSVLNAAQ